MKNLFFLFLFLSCSNLKHNQTNQSSRNEELIHIAVVNFKVKGMESFETHIGRIEEFARLSKMKEASYLLLPELMILDMLPENPAEEKMKEHLDHLALLSGRYEKGLKEISAKWKMGIIGASIIIKNKDHYLNRAFFITKTGQVKYQDKVKPTPWEIKHGFKGASEIKVFNTDKFSFAIMICHDAEFPSLSSLLVKTKPEVIFVPSQTDNVFGLNRVKYTSAARAVEHMSYVLMTGTSGNTKAPWHSYVGQNFFFTPQNSFFSLGFSEGPFNKEHLSIFTIDLEKLRQARRDPKQINPARDI